MDALFDGFWPDDAKKVFLFTVAAAQKGAGHGIVIFYFISHETQRVDTRPADVGSNDGYAVDPLDILEKLFQLPTC